MICCPLIWCLIVDRYVLGSLSPPSFKKNVCGGYSCSIAVASFDDICKRLDTFGRMLASKLNNFDHCPWLSAGVSRLTFFKRATNHRSELLF